MSRTILVILLVLMLVQTACAPVPTKQSSGLASLEQAASDDFTRAKPGREFQFPLDHGPHNEFQTEWWYYTGNLETADGDRFGYQLTFFRRALRLEGMDADRASTWAATQVYMAHFTITNAQDGSFRYFERLERGAVGLAGATSQPLFRAWLVDWSVEQVGKDEYHLFAKEGDVSLDLVLQDGRGVFLQGVEGYSQKGKDPGNASYYYSQPRLISEGKLVIAGQEYEVEGESWMDHEFSTSALEEDQAGWDWFALQLDDGSELMVFTLRTVDMAIDEYSQGMLILPDGSQRRLERDEFSIAITKTWQSPHTGAQYPAGWILTIPDEELLLEVKPLIPDQELRVSFTYWEGAVEAQGTRRGNVVTGRGYVELTGYAHTMQGRL